MIFSKIGQAIQAFFNGIANALIARDPISVMQLEIDRQAERLRTGREGVEQYRGLVERVARQVAMGTANTNRLTAQIKSHLKAGNEAMAAQLAVQLKAGRDELTQNTEQLTMHEEAYKNHLLKLQEGNKNMAKLREKTQKYSAELKMSAAEAEIARVAESLGQSLSGNLTTDLGQIESVIQGQIDANRGRARVAADMSSQGVDEIKATQRAEQVEAMEILDQFKVEMGLKSPETTPVSESTTKDLGPAQTN
ncbi:MAG: PspA/IM30 family protein [Gemmatimonadaceae bacterium]